MIFSLRGLPGGPREGPGGAPEGRQPGPLGNRGGAENVCIYKQILKKVTNSADVLEIKRDPGRAPGGTRGVQGGPKSLIFTKLVIFSEIW